jgi:PAS domain S-box-containing protein
VLGLLVGHSHGNQGARGERATTVGHRTDPAPTAGVAADVMDPHSLTRARLALAVDAAGLGTFDWDIRTGRLDWDDRLCEVFGLDPADFDSRIDTFFDALLPEDRSAVEDAVGAAIDTCGEYEAEYRVRHPDGSIRWVEARGRVYPGPDGEPARMLGVARDSTEVRSARDTVARTLEHMADGFLTVDRTWRIGYANHQAERVLGLLHDGLVGALLWDVLPGALEHGDDEYYREALAVGEPRTYEVYAPGEDGWHQVRIFPTDDGLSVYLTDISARRAQDLERARRLGRPEQARRVLGYSQALAEAETVDDVTGVIARMVLPVFGADGLLISVADSGKLRLVGHAGYDPGVLPALDGIALTEEAPIAEVSRTRSPLFLTSLAAYAAGFPSRAGTAARTGKNAWAFLPLVVSGRVLGTMTVSFRDEHSFGDEERSLLVTLAGLLAQTLERSRLRQAEHELATALQRGLLPRRLADVLGVRVSARYLTATDGMEVGGDWYDVIALPTGGVGLVVGDVQGHNVTAAATMGQLRNGLRAYAAEGHDPATVVERTNRLMAEIEGELFATCCYVQVDPAAMLAHVVRAGHPEPLLRTRTGVHPLECDGGLPLGVAPDEEYPVTTVPLSDGDVLLLFTDGLVENSGTPIDHGLERVTAVLAAGPDGVEELSTAVLRESLAAQHRPDDIAVLVARFDGVSAAGTIRPSRLRLDEGDLGGVPVARTFLRRVLDEASAPYDADTAVLLTNELVTNGLMHAQGPVTVDVRLTRGRLRIEVSDGVASSPKPVDPGDLSTGGRGLGIVASLADRWGTAPRGKGKTVWFELEASPRG